MEFILDKSQRTDEYSSTTLFYNADISVQIDVQHAITHSNLVIIDGETVITESFNFTKAAEKTMPRIC